MRVVTRFTSFDSYGGMLKDKWAALFRVALQARFFIGERLVNHSRARSHAPRW